MKLRPAQISEFYGITPDHEALSTCMINANCDARPCSVTYGYTAAGVCQGAGSSFGFGTPIIRYCSGIK